MSDQPGVLLKILIYIQIISHRVSDLASCHISEIAYNIHGGQEQKVKGASVTEKIHYIKSWDEITCIAKKYKTTAIFKLE